MRRLALFLAGVFGCVVAASAAQAAVSIRIDLSSQTMRVTSGSGESHTWAVSTARSGFSTPRGAYRPQRLARMHYSRKYNMSPMPHSIFFRGGYAIHGTSAVGALGRPASHGCVRLAPANAARLFAMVKAEGARIEISGSPPSSTRYAKASKKKVKSQYAARRTRHHVNPMAYAPRPAAPRVVPMRMWLQNPSLY